MNAITVCRHCGNDSRPYEGRVMSPFLDWSFKYLFGTEENKSNLIGLLNIILMSEIPIVDVEFMNNESLPVSTELKGCVFDIICKDSKGERYLIEMQNQEANNVKERIIYYTCRMIDRMGQRGSQWNYKDIKKVYTICMMNFIYESSPKLRRDIQLCDVNEGMIFSDKLNIILLQLPCIKVQNIRECTLFYEHLLYLLQQMHIGMKSIEELKREVAETTLPQETKELFYKVLDTAEIASLSEKDRMRYESDWKNYLDTMSCIERAEEKGKEEKAAEIARSLKSNGVDIGIIAKSTGFTIKEIENL